MAIPWDEYLRMPNKWQASSHPELAKHKPGELLGPELAESYLTQHADLLARITHLHCNILLLEELQAFDFFDLLGELLGAQIWPLVWQNTSDMCLILIHALVNEKTKHKPDGSGAVSIEGLKKELFKGEWLDKAMKQLFTTEWTKRAFNKECKSVKERVRENRNKRIAHRVLPTISAEQQTSVEPIELGELRTLFDRIHAMFGLMSFGSAYVTVSPAFTPPRKSALCDVLDALLRNSEEVSRPERECEFWHLQRSAYGEDRLAHLNAARRRIGLPEA